MALDLKGRKMNSKERVKTALAHQEPDKVPCGEWEPLPNDFAEQVLGRPSHLGFWNAIEVARALWAGKRDEVVMSMKKDLVELVRKFDWDVVPVFLVIDKDAPVPETPLQVDAETWQTKAGDILALSEGRIMWTKPGQQTPSPSPFSLLQASKYPTDSELELIRHVKHELGNTHFLLGCLPVGHPQLSYSRVWGRENDLLFIYEEPEKWLAGAIEETERAFPIAAEVAKREGLDGIWYGHDMGHSRGPFLPPRIFQQTIAKVLARRSEILHGAGLLHMLHACGNNRVVMDMIVDAGVDVYQSIQPEMPIAELKKSFGRKLALWGGVPAELLLNGTGSQIRESSLEILRNCSQQGGYVFGTSHSIMPGSIPEKYYVMLNALKEWNARKIRS